MKEMKQDYRINMMGCVRAIQESENTRIPLQLSIKQVINILPN